MIRPKSIQQFEILYLVAFLLGLVSTWQSWSAQSTMLANSVGRDSGPMLSYAAIALRAAVALALWYFVARKRSVIAKWIVAACALWGAILLVMVVLGLLSGATAPAIGVVAILQNLLYIAAAGMLFRPDARGWFGETTRVEIGE
ncbi:hypothetical protein ASE86_10860 [Sphingomonas sp. Leaf33]|uniref:hypothetical protein n=1 Tax=Sphingomonas sp. Leaf33 TaxID=1736215 RepID=UPI0006FF482E|nr:hypothetical protein [Sphingomonas sp. Leaf33]KQN26577.1 hypothetical protein ASE86_10860 [Sphingomonas sp. Leaf33]